MGTDREANGKLGMGLGEAANIYITTLPDAAKEASYAEVQKFVRWFGQGRVLDKLTPPEVGGYAEGVSQRDTDYVKKLKVVHDFLTHAKKVGWVRTNLAIHLKPAKKNKPKVNGSGTAITEMVPVTEEGYNQLISELAELKGRRPQILEDITHAAADKDFRENAPLHAAREELGHLDGRIKQIEATLKRATVVDSKNNVALSVHVGDDVILVDQHSGEEMFCTIVGPREANPARGRISGVSPVGKAVLGRHQGETVEVFVPAGIIRYTVKQIKRQGNNVQVE